MVARKMEINQKRFGACMFVVLLVLAGSAPAWTAQNPPSNPAPAAGEKVATGYPIGPGDVLEIRVADGPEVSGKFRVTETGDLELPLLRAPLKAAGLTTLQLSRNIAEALKAADILREPAVNIFVQEYHSRNVMVLG